MRRAGHLFERVLAWPNLLRAAREAARGKRSRRPAAAFLFHLEPELLRLQDELAQGAWRPGSFTTFEIRDPKPRVISAAPFRDRVVHHALMGVLDPYFERQLIAHTYACRRGRGSHAALARARRWARRYPYVLKADVEHFFETADHEVLLAQLRRLFKDRRLLALLERIVAAGPEGARPGRGLPIGNLTSQYFANHMLGRADHFAKQQLCCRAYLRYLDDSLFFSHSKARLHRVRAELRRFLAEELRLRLKEEATWIAPTASGVPFLGFRVYPGTIRLAGPRWRRSLARIRRLERACRAGQVSEAELARRVGSVLAHWSHAASHGLRCRLFGPRQIPGEAADEARTA